MSSGDSGAAGPSPASGARPLVAGVRPAPEPAVLAAIVAAVEEAWPRPAAAEPPRAETPLWRFSGRWWALPTAARRERPWIGGKA